jgi:hypothetical protein
MSSHASHKYALAFREPITVVGGNMGEVDGNKNRKPIAVDLFSGAGGLSQGLKMAGFDIRLAVESEIDPCVTYMENTSHMQANSGHTKF